MITDYIGGEGSAETPKSDYVIYGWPLTSSLHTMEIHPISFLDKALFIHWYGLLRLKVQFKTEKHWISKVHIFMDWTEFQI